MTTTKYRYKNFTGWNDLGHYAQTTRWTEISKHCYKRNCICEGCMYSCFFIEGKQNCKVKAHVLALVTNHGRPKDIDLPQVLAED